MTTIGSRPRAALLALQLLAMGAFAAPAPALAMQILEAADHAELAAEISATGVSRIALAGDRIARVVRSPDGFAVEHDPASGDLYLKPAVSADAGMPGVAGAPATLFIGTEKGFTYRVTLTPAERGPAQILIRNADAARTAVSDNPAAIGGARVAALVKLVRAVAGRAPLPGYEIHAGKGLFHSGFTLIETWRGPRFRALVLEADALPAAAGDGAAAGLAGTVGTLPGMGRVAALWLAAPGTGPAGGRLAVAVTESALPAREPGQAAGAPR